MPRAPLANLWRERHRVEPGWAARYRGVRAAQQTSGVAVLRKWLGLARIDRRLTDFSRVIERLNCNINELKETVVANFDTLNSKLDEQDAARAAAVERINADVQALRDQIAALELDTDDQAKVDAIVTRVQGNVDALNAIDPVRADDSTVPTEPTA